MARRKPTKAADTTPGGTTPAISERALSRLILAAVLLATAVGLWPDLTVSRVDQSDAIDHFTNLDGMVRAVEQGGNPIDFWGPEIAFGSPVFRTYQPLAHGLVAAAYFALGKAVSLVTVFSWVRFLAMWLLPVSFFAAAALLELPPLACAAAALLAPMISSVGGGLFGIEYRSYLWIGFGLFPQSVSMHTLLLAIGFGWQAIRYGRRLTLTGILLGLTCLLHFINGYLGAVTVCLLALVPNPQANLRARIGRTAWIGIAAVVVSLFQLLSILQDGAILNHSRFEPAVKWDSYGAGQVLSWLFSGDMFDYGRLPAFTVLVLAGMALAGWRLWRSRGPAREWFLAGGAVFWLLVYFGRPTWGPLLYLVGVSGEMHLHRVVVGFQVFAVLLAGLALEAIWRGLGKRSAGFALAATAILLFPMVRDRARLLTSNATQGAENLAAWDAARPVVDTMVASARRNGGRAYAGLGTNWGSMFKIGVVPFFAELSVRHVPAVSFMYSNLSLTSDIMMGFDETRPEHYRLFNVRTVITPKGPGTPPFLTPRAQAGELLAYNAPGGGYFEMVDVPAAVAANRATFYDIDDRWLRSDWMARGQHLLLDFFGDAPPNLPRLSPLANLNAAAAGASAGTVRGEREAFQQYEADVSATRPGYALFKMTWHQNWKAWVDGQPVRTAMLTPGFIGIPVAAGAHHVLCRYQGDGLRLWLALAGALLAAGMWAAEARAFGRRPWHG